MLSLLTLLSCKDQPTKPNDPFIPPDGDPYRTIDGEPDWSRVADVIVFTHLPQDSSEALNGDYQVWTMDLQTRERKFITQGRNARWSPDGMYIAFRRGGTIWIREMSSGEEKKIINYTARFPTWHPDGLRVSYDLNYNDSVVDYSIALTSINDVGIVQRVGLGMEPCWSPKGDKVIYSYPIHYDRLPSELFIMDSIGNNVIQLTDNVYDDNVPRYSPDGTKITWVMNGTGGEENPVNGIWTMNVDGSDERKVVYGGMPSFSNDGKKIIYYGFIDSLKIATLLTVNLDGTDIQPVWLPDSLMKHKNSLRSCRKDESKNKHINFWCCEAASNW